MSESDEIKQIRAELTALKAENVRLWEAVRSLRHNPALDIPVLDKVMRFRYGVRPPPVR
jgi:hypothetical protein